MLESFLGKSTRVKIAVCGELNSGKTSLLNALYRDGTVPDFFGIPNKPVIKIAFSANKNLITYTTLAGLSKTVTAPDQIPLDGSVRDVEIFTQDDTFGASDVIEFTRLRDGYVSDEEVAEISGCDILIWMTIGSQAWRLSEKTIIGKFPNLRPALSILAVSRADKFRSDADMKRLETRVVKETKGIFDHHLMMRLEPEALESANADDDAWNEIGGKGLVACLSELVENITPIPSDEPMPQIQVTPKDKVATKPVEDAPTPELERSFKSSRRMRRISKMLANRFGEPGAEPSSPTQDADETQGNNAKESIKTNVLETLRLPTEAEKSTEAGDTTSKIAEIAESLDDLMAMVSFASTNHEDVTLIAGDHEFGKTLAQKFGPAVKLLIETEFYEQPQWGHLSTKTHQILYRVENNGDSILALACQTGNVGIARNAFQRIIKLQDEKGLELA